MKNTKKKLALALAITMSTVTFATAYVTMAPPVRAAEVETSNAKPIRNDEPTYERINQYKDLAMYYYWHGGDIKQSEKDIFKGITLKGKYDVVENAFKEATLLDPFDLDLKFSLASTLIIEKKVPEALHTYRQILNLDPSNFNANLLNGVYSKASGDEATYKASIAKLKLINAQKTNQYLQKIERTEKVFNEKLSTTPPANVQSKNHAIVILGYALADDGTMQPTLIERLKTGLAVVNKYPNSKIIVTGGVPKQGVTESDAMSQWLIAQGVNPNRIILENKSTDTVENGLFSTAILEREGLKDVTIVTSASHIRRALAVFKEADSFYSKMNGKAASRNFTNAVYLDYKSLEEAQKVTNDEKLVIYRDLLRTSGIWQYPGLQR
ncbi:YdcF family protein [Paenibacillus agri]|uniref:YdcF family protein n=1 Tax=Paenibacillus agri TaxID=2744309 RepID=A0A850EGF7_9BACL|nr:YdcF family protein [Paenibacillus agri]NUU60413.1 YdcF family protein [Paenibacillus agri]